MIKRTKILFFVALTLMGLENTSCTQGSKSQPTAQRENSEWIWLFDGSSTDTWRSVLSDHFPEEGWVICDSLLMVIGRNDSVPAGKDIITKEQYGNFELQLDFKLSNGGNSGIKYFVVNDFPGYEGKYLGMEFQLIDDDRYETTDLGPDGNRTMGSLYDLIPAQKNKQVNSPGEWNSAKILVDGKHVEHWLNGQKILEFERGSDAFRALVGRSKYKNMNGFGEMPRGHIMLQGHKTDAAFREIKIRTW